MALYLRSSWLLSILLIFFIACLPGVVMSGPAKEWMAESCNEAEIEKLQKESHARLSPKIRNILNRDYHGWFFSKNCVSPYSSPSDVESPHFISGDFDSNGHTDYAVLIGHADKFLFLVFFKKAGEFKIQILRTGHDEDIPYMDIHLILYKKDSTGAYLDNGDETKYFVYPHDSFKFWWGTTSDVYIFERGSFKVLDMGD